MANFSFAKEKLNWKIVQGGRFANMQHNAVNYLIFSPDNPSQIKFFWQNQNGKNYSSFYNLRKSLIQENKKAIFLTNAAIYSKKYQPAGLWIENQKQLVPLNQNDGKGNFHIKPAGVFLIKGNKADLLTLDEYISRKPEADFAFQAAPMLIINGKINSRFKKNIFSPYIRNAVCISNKDDVFFVITNNKDNAAQYPNFYEFSEALLKMGCYRAVYLDGSISAVYGENFGSIFHLHNFVGIIAVLEK